MGNTTDTTGKLVFNNTAQTVADFQALGNQIRAYVDRSVANAAARDALPYKKEGMLVETADDDQLWMCVNPASSGTWQRIGATNASVTLARSSNLTAGVTSAPKAAEFQSASFIRGMTWAVGQPTRLYAPIAGRYAVDAVAGVGSTNIGYAWIRINGTTDLPNSSAPHSSGIALVRVPTTMVTLAAGQYIELMTQSDGTYNLYSSTLLNADLVNAR